jgi:hypothetical protein
MKARHKLLTVFSVLGGLMAIAAVGWACTALVGPTYITDTDSTPNATNQDLTQDGIDDTPGVPASNAPVVSNGSYVSAKGFVVEGRETRDCPDDGCTYELVTTSGPALSCHVNNATTATGRGANETDHGPVTELNDTVTAPSRAGEYSACFRSDELNSNQAPTAGTSGAPFLVLP